MRKAILVEGAVKPAGQYSHAVIANGFVSISGQGPKEFFTDEPPARATVGSQLVGIQVEIDCVAVLPD